MKYTYSESIAQNMKEIMDSEEHTSLFSKTASKKCEHCSEDLDNCTCGDNNYSDDLSLDYSNAEDSSLGSRSSIDVAIHSLIKAAEDLESLGLIKSSSSALTIANLVVEAKKKMMKKKKKMKEKSDSSKSESRSSKSKSSDSSSMPEFLKKKLKSASLNRNLYSYSQMSSTQDIGKIRKNLLRIKGNLESKLNDVNKSLNNPVAKENIRVMVETTPETRELETDMGVNIYLGYLNNAYQALFTQNTNSPPAIKNINSPKLQEIDRLIKSIYGESSESNQFTPGQAEVAPPVAMSNPNAGRKSLPAYVKDLQSGVAYLLKAIQKATGAQRDGLLRQLNNEAKELNRVYRQVAAAGKKATPDMAHTQDQINAIFQTISTAQLSPQDINKMPDFKNRYL